MIDNGAAQAVKIFHRRNRKEAPLYEERGTILVQVGTQWDVSVVWAQWDLYLRGDRQMANVALELWGRGKGEKSRNTGRE